MDGFATQSGPTGKCDRKLKRNSEPWRTDMKLSVTLATALSLLASGSIFAQAGGESAPNALQAAPVQDSQTIRIMRNSSQPLSQGTSEHFTGSVRIGPLFTEN